MHSFVPRVARLVFTYATSKTQNDWPSVVARFRRSSFLCCHMWGFPLSSTFLFSLTEECINCLVINHTLLGFKKVKAFKLYLSVQSVPVTSLVTEFYKFVSALLMPLNSNIRWSPECIIKSRGGLGLRLFHLPFQLFHWYVILPENLLPWSR